MKKMMMVILVVAMMAASACGNKDNYYARVSHIIELDYENDIAVVEDDFGFTWEFYGCEDWSVGDCCILTMKQCGDEYIFDDEIVATTYYNER